jgi:hypothetical protein
MARGHPHHGDWTCGIPAVQWLSLRTWETSSRPSTASRASGISITTRPGGPQTRSRPRDDATCDSTKSNSRPHHLAMASPPHRKINVRHQHLAGGSICRVGEREVSGCGHPGRGRRETSRASLLRPPPSCTSCLRGQDFETLNGSAHRPSASTISPPSTGNPVPSIRNSGSKMNPRAK